MKKKTIHIKKITLLISSIIGLLAAAVAIQRQRTQEGPMQDVSPTNEVTPSKDVATDNNMSVEMDPKAIPPVEEPRQAAQGWSWKEKATMAVGVVVAIALAVMLWNPQCPMHATGTCLTYLNFQRSIPKMKDSALHDNVKNGDLKNVKTLVKAGANIHAKNKAGDTALTLSAQKRDLAIVTYLLQEDNYSNTEYKDEVKSALEKCKGNNEISDALQKLSKTD